MSTIGDTSLSAIKKGNPSDGGAEIVTACLGNKVVFENENYIQFQDAEIKRICCVNWGTYKQIVTVDNGDDTVTITTTKIKKKNTSVLYRANISTITRAKSEDDVAGTVNEPLGMTYKQAAAVTSIGSTVKSSSAFTFNEFQYFTKITAVPSYRNVSTLKEITLPSSIKSIPNNCFDGCSSLTSCILNEGLKTIGRNVFNFAKFTKLIIPSTVTAIVGRDFAGANSLRTVILLAVNPPTNSDFNLFTAANSSVRLYVPDDSLDTYKASAKWNEMASRIYPLSDYSE